MLHNLFRNRTVWPSLAAVLAVAGLQIALTREAQAPGFVTHWRVAGAPTAQAAPPRRATVPVAACAKPKKTPSSPVHLVKRVAKAVEPAGFATIDGEVPAANRHGDPSADRRSPVPGSIFHISLPNILKPSKSSFSLIGCPSAAKAAASSAASADPSGNSPQIVRNVARGAGPLTVAGSAVSLAVEVTVSPSPGTEVAELQQVPPRAVFPEPRFARGLSRATPTDSISHGVGSALAPITIRRDAQPLMTAGPASADQALPRTISTEDLNGLQAAGQIMPRPIGSGIMGGRGPLTIRPIEMSAGVITPASTEPETSLPPASGFAAAQAVPVAFITADPSSESMASRGVEPGALNSELGSAAAATVAGRRDGEAKANSLIAEIVDADVTLDVILHRSKLIRTRTPITRISVAQPDMLEVVQHSPSQFETIGVQAGQTTMTLWFGDKTLRYLVRILPSQAR